jgi:hypothetical protein
MNIEQRLDGFLDRLIGKVAFLLLNGQEGE